MKVTVPVGWARLNVPPTYRGVAVSNQSGSSIIEVQELIAGAELRKERDLIDLFPNLAPEKTSQMGIFKGRGIRYVETWEHRPGVRREHSVFFPEGKFRGWVFLSMVEIQNMKHQKNFEEIVASIRIE